MLDYLNTHWEHITLKDMLDYIKKNHLVPIDLSVSFLSKYIIFGDNNVPDKKRVNESDTSYPLIVLSVDNKVKNILNGNHRLMKAINNGIEKLPCYVVEFNNLPDDWKNVFR